MSTLANSPADELVQSKTSVDVATGASSIDLFVGSCVRIKRTSRGMTRHELSELRAARLLFSGLHDGILEGGVTFRLKC